MPLVLTLKTLPEPLPPEGVIPSSAVPSRVKLPIGIRPLVAPLSTENKRRFWKLVPFVPMLKMFPKPLTPPDDPSCRRACYR